MKDEERRRYWAIGHGLASFIQKNQPEPPTVLALHAAAADLLGSENQLLIPLRALTSTAAFHSLINELNSGDSAILSLRKDAILSELSSLFTKEVIECLSEILNGYLGIDVVGQTAPTGAPLNTFNHTDASKNASKTPAKLFPGSRAFASPAPFLVIITVSAILFSISYLLCQFRSICPIKRDKPASPRAQNELRDRRQLQPTTNATLIEGDVYYPGEEIPPLEICATEVSTKQKLCSRYARNSINYTYSIAVPPGRYWISGENTELPTVKLWNATCIDVRCEDYIVTAHTVYGGLRQIKGADLGHYGPNVGFEN